MMLQEKLIEEVTVLKDSVELDLSSGTKDTHDDEWQTLLALHSDLSILLNTVKWDSFTTENKTRMTDFSVAFSKIKDEVSELHNILYNKELERVCNVVKQMNL